MSTLEDQVAEEQAAYEADTGPNVKPRRQNVETERGKANEVEFFNRLVVGKGADLRVHAHVAGTKTTHRRDSEGNVDAVLATRSLIITDVSLLND